MAENSKIEWTDHTFNPWMGCTRVSEGCRHCYAETLMDHRWGKVQWGPQGVRVRTTEAKWREPLKWNRQQWGECNHCGWRGAERGDPLAKAKGFVCPECKAGLALRTRQRVFCGSLCDVFEDKPDQREQLNEWRLQLFELIDRTPHLDWLLLTKRPENIKRLWPFGWYDDQFTWRNVWIGTSIENQRSAHERIPELIKIPAAIRFLSIEPLLGPVALGAAFPCGYYCDPGMDGGGHHDHPFWSRVNPQIHWAIIGGESGPGARRMDVGWVRDLMRQCDYAQVPVFVKQMGTVLAHELHLKDKKGGNIEEWPADLRVRQFPLLLPSTSDVAELAAAWPGMPDLEGGVDLFAAKHGEPTGSEVA
ncbi:MAG: DUF5131 family protein [Caldilineaceae bacterium]|nr:DUF5131 family protein [Caldilineaceae bacterium]